jgi:Heterokaryon incompatibility protein (HET)
MRLLNCALIGEATPVLEEFYDDIPPYAILSHRWGKATEEVSFKDIETGADISHKEGFRKFQYCCQQALKDGLQYAWIDTCCIDKSSSAELSEAINSMYNWYLHSQVCYAYLNDVSGLVSEDPEEILNDLEREDSSFRKSAWFTRGWTLQELIAPKKVRFYSETWEFVGDKRALADLVSNITGIDAEVLTRRTKPYSVAQRMSWAAGRKTTRVEDRAYSLMGIFGVNVPPLYGEGHKAFVRLQEEIMRQSFDHSLFAWKPQRQYSGLLAESPDQFSHCGDIVTVSYNKYVEKLNIEDGIPDYAQTNFGTRIQLALQQTTNNVIYRASIACTRQESNKHYHKLLNPDYFLYIYFRKYSGVGVNTYSQYYDSVDVDDPYNPDERDSCPIRAEVIYVSSTQTGLFSQAPVPKSEVHFQMRIEAAHQSRYFYGKELRTATLNKGKSSFIVGLEKDQGSVVAIELGRFVPAAIGKGDDYKGYRDFEEGMKLVVAVFGVYESRVWVDICLRPGVWDDVYPTLLLSRLWYLGKCRSGRTLDLSTKARKQWKGLVSGKPGIWQISADISVDEVGVFDASYHHCVVNFYTTQTGQS